MSFSGSSLQPPMPPKREPEFWKLLWDTMEKLREEVAANALEIAIIKTKVAFVAGSIGLFGGIAGSIISGAVVYWIKSHP